MARSLRSLSGSIAAAPTHRAIFAPHPKTSACHHSLSQRQPGLACDPHLNHTRFFAALEDAGLPPVPQEFSVVPRCQVIKADFLQQIARFIAVFGRVIARDAWRMAACRDAPE